jgi:Ni,Fe-hydrogenase III large subunit/Ni,Fe-hydrogenase III component G
MIMELRDAPLALELEATLGREPELAGSRAWLLTLPAAQLPATVSQLRREHQARLVDLFGVRGRDGVQLRVLLALDTRSSWLWLISDLPASDATFPTLTTVAPAAGWYERELWSELDVHPDGNPGPAALRLPPDWPAAGRAWSAELARTPPAPTLVEAPEGVVDFPLGPVRSGVVESGHYLLRTVGEEIIDIALRLFYKHRGVEQLALGLGLLHLPLVAERISGTDAFAESLALCQALEALAEAAVPPRAAALRTVFEEIERLYNHLGYQAELCRATGLVVGQAQFEILKERVLRLNARVAGHRYLFGLNVPGGVSRDLTREDRLAIHETTAAIWRQLDALGPMLFASSSHVDRLEGTGKLRPEDARDCATVGPVARASGQDRDLRRDHPYAAYRDVEIAVPVQQDGDALSRARVRLEETTQSLHVIAQLLDRLPAGSTQTPVTLPPNRDGLGWAESTHGETVHWIATDAEGRVCCYRVRTASFANWQAFPLAVPGHNILTDFPIIEQSFGLSYAGNDC